jgi:hypothetical protein
MPGPGASLACGALPAALAANKGCRRVVCDTGIFACAQRFEHGQREPLAVDVDFAQQRLGMAMLTQLNAMAVRLAEADPPDPAAAQRFMTGL